MNNKRPKLIYTPEHHIPIGEVVEKDGSRALKIKKAGDKKEETITLDELLTLIYHPNPREERC